ncbi:MAG: hypothetical protein IPI35_03375 [Deltaproteobacteria bacterium]|nr:hypothetical protein [Deltaproteobacteria bacterium]
MGLIVLFGLFGAGSAWAFPSRLAATLDGVTATGDLAIKRSPDGQYVGVLSSTALDIIDTETWDVQTVGVCGGAAGLAVAEDTASGDVVFYYGCADGTVSAVQITDGVLDAWDAEPVTDNAVQGLAVQGDTLWALAAGADSGLIVVPVMTADLSASAVSSATLVTSGFEDMESMSGYVLVNHGSNNISRIDVNTGAAAVAPNDALGSDFQDLEIYGNGIFLADANGALVRYQISTSNNPFQYILDDEVGLLECTALAIDDAGEWLALADLGAESLFLFTFDSTSYTVEKEPLATIDLSAVGELTGLSDAGDYLLATSSAGEVLVFTELPWVEIVNRPTAAYTTGEQVSFQVTSDLAGEWSARLGSVSGDELDFGELSADEAAEVTFTVGDDWEEGDQRVFIVVDSAGVVGRAAVDVTVNNPPAAPDVAEVGFGDGKIIVSIAGDAPSDYARYDIYITTTAFVASDYSEGGPEYSGPDDGISSPVALTINDPAEPVEIEITGLTNGQTYYVSVRAVDASDTEGPMSDIYEVTPAETFGAADLAGEKGGFCATTPHAAGLGLGLFALLATRRRRRAGLGVAALGLALAPAAQAAEPVKGHRDADGEIVLDRSMQLSVSSLGLTDENIGLVYGDRAMLVIHGQASLQAFRVLQLDAGMGAMRKAGTMVTAEGVPGSEEAKLTLVPLSLGVTGRLDLIDGQPIVPYGAVALDYWLWREREGSIDPTNPFDLDALGGGKPGYHYALGVNVLLDWLDPRGASEAGAVWDVDDTYLSVEWRRDSMFRTEGLSFAGNTLTVGVKVDR